MLNLMLQKLEYYLIEEGRIVPSELDRQIHAMQPYCYTCGKKFDRVKYECPTCGEWQCSEVCLSLHIETLDNI